MHDFSAVDPSEVTWRRGGRKGSVIADGKRVVVQTPRFPCRVSTHSPGILRADMRVMPGDPVHARFAEWVAGLEASATGDWKDGLSLSTAIYGTNFRMLLFSDTLVFDEHGSLSADCADAKSGAFLLELVGAWTSPGRWGLRWKVVQFKFWRTCDAVGSEVEDDVGLADGAECLFVD